jgi:hypothetical protein
MADGYSVAKYYLNQIVNRIVPASRKRPPQAIFPAREAFSGKKNPAARRRGG